jgi:hypothetical protein
MYNHVLSVRWVCLQKIGEHQFQSLVIIFPIQIAIIVVYVSFRHTHIY